MTPAINLIERITVHLNVYCIQISPLPDPISPMSSRWLGSVVVEALDLRSRGHRFDSRPFHSRVATMGKLFTPMCASVTKQYNLVPAKGR